MNEADVEWYVLFLTFSKSMGFIGYYVFSKWIIRGELFLAVLENWTSFKHRKYNVKSSRLANCLGAVEADVFRDMFIISNGKWFKIIGLCRSSQTCEWLDVTRVLLVLWKICRENRLRGGISRESRCSGKQTFYLLICSQWYNTFFRIFSDSIP